MGFTWVDFLTFPKTSEGERHFRSAMDDRDLPSLANYLQRVLEEYDGFSRPSPVFRWTLRVNPPFPKRRWKKQTYSQTRWSLEQNRMVFSQYVYVYIYILLVFRAKSDDVFFLFVENPCQIVPHMGAWNGQSYVYIYIDCFSSFTSHDPWF